MIIRLLLQSALLRRRPAQSQESPRRHGHNCHGRHRRGRAAAAAEEEAPAPIGSSAAAAAAGFGSGVTGGTRARWRRARLRRFCLWRRPCCSLPSRRRRRRRSAAPAAPRGLLFSLFTADAPHRHAPLPRQESTRDSGQNSGQKRGCFGMAAEWRARARTALFPHQRGKSVGRALGKHAPKYP